MNFRLAVLLTLLPSYLLSQKQIYIPQEWQQGGFDYSLTRSAESDNFIVFWGPLAGDDPTQAPGDISFDPQNILTTAESLYKFYIDTIQFINDDAGLIHQYKIILVMLNTWPDYDGWAFGGNYDGVVGAMWMHPQAASSGPTLAHEFTHTLQNYTWMMNPGHGFIDSSYVGFFWETHAEFMALQRYPSVALEFDMARWLNTCQFHWSSTRHHYQAFVFLQFIKEKDGIGMINRMWNEANIGEHPLETFKRLKNITQDQLNDLFGEYAMRNVTWDYEIGDLLRDRVSTLNPVFVSHPTIIPELIDSASQRYRIQNHLAPQDYGYNIIQLYPQELEGCQKRIVYLNLLGQYTFPHFDEAGLRFGFVAVDNLGHPRYSELYIDHKETSFEMEDDESELYLVVTGAPAHHHNYPWEIGFPKIYRFPYEFKLENAFPEGFQPGFHETPAVPGAPHINGGGFVAASALVSPTAYIGPHAQVLDDARVLDHASIEDYAIIEHSAIVKDDAVVSGLGIIGESAQVYGNAVVTGQAHVFGSSEVFDSAFVDENTLIFNTKVFENASLAGNTFCWGANLHGDIHLGGDAEFFRECDDGTYLQFESAYDRNCDGLDVHPANVDITSQFISPEIQDYYSLTCEGLVQNIFTELSWVMCPGDTFYFNGQALTIEGLYEIIYPLANGADSIVTLFLLIDTPLEGFGSEDICPGDSLIVFGNIITQPGLYDLKSDTTNCASILHLSVTEIIIDTSITIVGNTLESNEPATIVQWYDCTTNLPVPGAIGRTFSPSVSGTYKAKFTSLSGCEAFTGCRTIILTGIDHQTEFIQWQIFPNPADDILNINIDHQLKQDVHVEILNTLGQQQMEQTILTKINNRIDVQSLPAGTFMIRLSDAKGNASMKLFSKI
ncbi:MAG TPA: DUF6055 domain-containing protein [Saprospiraceae bacterium]|nr:DUF6055 domain-containing protein [Saprospiraceae bacterium]